MAIENTHREFGYTVTFPCKPGDKVYYIETRYAFVVISYHLLE